MTATLTSALAQNAPVPTPDVNRWQITNDDALVWKINRGEAHEDNIEMTGQKVSVIVNYGVNATGALSLEDFAIFPTFRLLPHNTRSHITQRSNSGLESRFLLNGAAAQTNVVESVRLKGILEINGRMTCPEGDVAWTRTIFPSTTKPVVIEMISLKNVSPADIDVNVEAETKTVVSDEAKGVDGAYVTSSRMQNSGERMLKPGEATVFVRLSSTRRQKQPEISIDATAELQARRALVESYGDTLQLVTPNKVLNTMFAFAKIRAAESIISTKSGLMHAPGGGRYYAAVWANDQIEYAAPFFPFLGDTNANNATSNAFRLFATHINPDYKPIPYAIVAEGAMTKHEAGDRGDMAMLAYGATRYALASGDKAIAEQKWPLIEWSLEYCRRKVGADGVVQSDSDELENRLPAGKANLCTSSLYYDALNSAVYLGRELGKPRKQLEHYATEAKQVKEAIERYFGAEVEGFHTYRYFDKAVPSVSAKARQRHAHYAKEPDHLRAWICIPLTVGIFDRARGTIDALFSPNLWTADGLATESGRKDFWDRSTLYAFRGAFASGETERTLKYLEAYSTRRLTGDHVPYAVEAYPEGGQSHLAAESALYCRVYIEGLFGIRPTGLHSFTCKPRLPQQWPSMELRNIRAFGREFDLIVSRAGKQLQVQVLENGKTMKSLQMADGDMATIDLKD